MNPDGSVKVDTVSKDSRPPVALRLGSIKRLAELQPDYVFYTLGLPLLHSPLPEPPIELYQKTNNITVESLAVQFQRPVFTGMEHPVFRDKTLNHQLLAVPTEHWEPYATLMRGIMMVQRQSHVVYQLRLKELTIVDPVAVDRKEVGTFVTGRPPAAFSPMIKIWAVCLETNHGSYYVDDAIYPAAAKFTSDVFPDFAEIAAKILQQGPQ